MRIRKNGNFSSRAFSPAETHVCELNQSPWDVISFAQESYPSSLARLQLEGEDSFNGNSSLADSIGAVESSSFHSTMAEVEEKKAAIDDSADNKIQSCSKRDSKGWHCKNETKQGHSMCDHYSAAAKSALPSAKKPEKNNAAGRRGQAKAAKKGANSAANPYEFYYYSGFGPLWGKRRGGGGGGGEVENKSVKIDGGKHNTTPYSPASSIDHFDGLDFLDEDDDDEDSDKIGDSGKKRPRKPVKARSLKSLIT